jgi:hypothetical protein
MSSCRPGPPKKPPCQALPCLSVFGKPVPKYKCGKYVTDPFDFLVQQMALQNLDAAGNSINTPQKTRPAPYLYGGYSQVSAGENGGQYMPLQVPGQMLAGIAGSNTYIQTSLCVTCVDPPSTYGYCGGGTTLGIETRAAGTCGRFAASGILNGPGSRYM